MAVGPSHETVVGPAPQLKLLTCGGPSKIRIWLSNTIASVTSISLQHQRNLLLSSDDGRQMIGRVRRLDRRRRVEADGMGGEINGRRRVNWFLVGKLHGRGGWPIG
uniref:Uncharacterized protein n=1 Tax=Cucumis melo TaxID=3656 RepID=A0A9I9EFD6_CUCME